jgi:hypothetical protein
MQPVFEDDLIGLCSGLLYVAEAEANRRTEPSEIPSDRPMARNECP